MRIILNPDENEVQRIQRALHENDGYCPCRLKRTPGTKCICTDFLMQKDEGYCHCGLYKKVKD